MVKLYIILATQSIEAQAQQEGYRQACTIGLSINEDTKLEKGKEKKGSAARSFIQSSGHVSSRDYVYHNVYHNLPFSTSAVTLGRDSGPLSTIPNSIVKYSVRQYI